MQKNLNEFVIDKLYLSIFNKIAKWHNEESSASELKQVTLDIINEVTGEVCKHFEIPYSGEIKLDKEARNEALKAKNNL